VQIPLNLVQNVFRGSPEQDSACLWVRALCEEGEVLVTNLGNLEKTALSTNVRSGSGEYRVYDCRTCRTSDTVVVCLADSADGGDVGFDKVVLCEI
jgi:hypothetical protein